MKLIVTTDYFRLNLSELSSLQALEFAGVLGRNLNFLQISFPTLPSPKPLKIVIAFYALHSPRGFINWRTYCPKRFQALSKIHKERNFQLVLCLENSDVEMTKKIVEVLNGTQMETEGNPNPYQCPFVSQTSVISRHRTP